MPPHPLEIWVLVQQNVYSRQYCKTNPYMYIHKCNFRNSVAPSTVAVTCLTNLLLAEQHHNDFSQVHTQKIYSRLRH